MQKRILSLTIAVVLIISTIPVSNAATVTFSDVRQGSWYYESVSWAAENGIVNGIGNNKFDPTGKCTTEMILTMLYRFAGSAKPQSWWNTKTYSDVKQGLWYYNAVLWADTTGVRSGSGSTYGIGTDCKREDVCLYLWRMIDAPATTYQNAFKDVTSSAKEASAIQWAVNAGICNGVGGGKFGYGGSCDRSMIATFLYRFNTYVLKNSVQMVTPKMQETVTHEAGDHHFKYKGYVKQAITLDSGATTDGYHSYVCDCGEHVEFPEFTSRDWMEGCAAIATGKHDMLSAYKLRLQLYDYLRSKDIIVANWNGSYYDWTPRIRADYWNIAYYQDLGTGYLDESANTVLSGGHSSNWSYDLAWNNMKTCVDKIIAQYNALGYSNDQIVMSLVSINVYGNTLLYNKSIDRYISSQGLYHVG